MCPLRSPAQKEDRPRGRAGNDHIEEGEDAFWVVLGVLRKLTKTGNGTELDPRGCGFQGLSLWGRRDMSFSL